MMCMACQMEDELWLAYLDQVARQEKAAAEAADPTSAKKAQPASPFVCDEPPSE
jgi:hypothetical protein